MQLGKQPKSLPIQLHLKGLKIPRQINPIRQTMVRFNGNGHHFFAVADAEFSEGNFGNAFFRIKIGGMQNRRK